MPFPLVCFAVTCLLVASVVAPPPADDFTKGLDCQKDSKGKIIGCVGKNNMYTDSEKKINTYIQQHKQEVNTRIKNVQTRGFGGGVPPPGQSSSFPGQQPYNGPQFCRTGGCQLSVNQVYSPSLMFNTQAQPRFVLQLNGFNQFVHLAVCESEGSSCNGLGHCEQKYYQYTLLVWDPYFPEGGLSVESFEVPSSCCCSGPGGPGVGYPPPPQAGRPGVGASRPSINIGPDWRKPQTQ